MIKDYNHITPYDRVLIMHDLERTPVGAVVESWPLHCTLIPTFSPESALSVSALSQQVSNALKSMSYIRATHVETNFFGPNDNVPVAILSSEGQTKWGEKLNNGALELLHKRLMLLVAKLMRNATDMSYAYGHYVPHVSLANIDQQLSDFTVDSVTIGVKSAETKEKRVIARIER